MALQQLREKACVCHEGADDLEVEERTFTRKAKQYTMSDEIRHELAMLRISLMDDPDGTAAVVCVVLPAGGGRKQHILCFDIHGRYTPRD